LKTQLHRILLLPLFLFLFFEKANAYTFDWKGNTSANWATASNWTRTGSGGTSTYPGQSGSVDIVRIGVNNYTGNQPTLAASVSVASVEFGDNNGNSITLTVNTAVVLTVTGTVLQDHNAANGGMTVTVTGTGTAGLTCSALIVGNSAAPPVPDGDSLFGGNLPTNNTTTFDCNIAVLTINGDLTLHSTTSALATWTFFFVPIASNYSVNNPLFNLNSGTLTVNNIITTNGLYVSRNDGYYYVQTTANYKMDLGASTNTLKLLGANPITTATAGNIDFVSGGTVTASTVNYAATSGTQTIYTSADASVSPAPTVYPNLILSAASAKTVHGGTLSIGSDWTTSGGSVGLNTNNAIVTVADDWTNSTTITQGTGSISTGGDLSNTGTLTLGTGNLTVTGNYTNNGTYTQSIGNTIFNGASPALNDGGSGTIFNNVTFSGSGTALLNSGSFSVSNTGTLTMANTNILNANGHLTLISGSTSTATVATIPSTCSITGNVAVQRYITGGSATYRGYRLMSSPVNAGTVSGNKVYSINYLKNSMYLTATTTAGGFDNTSTANPTLYLYRENMTPAYSTFLNSNFRGVNNINASPGYTLDVDGSGFNIPVGNGFLCFFRGNRASATFAAETVSTYVPQAATLSTTGTLNQGQVTVTNWFTPASVTLSCTAGSPAAVKGYNLVGNPYASSIDWNTFQTASTSTNIYGTANVGNTIWMLDPVSKNFGAYVSGTPGGTGTNSSSHVIASGQAFFVVVSSAGGKLIFNEGAKTGTQPNPVTAPKLLMGMPADYADNQYLRLQLAMDSVNTDDILLRFKSNVSTAYVPNLDAAYKTGFGVVSLSSLSSDQIPLAINVQPLPDNSETIKLTINTAADGNYSLNMKNLVGIPQLFDIWLMDAFKKDSLDMRHNTSYHFNVLKSDSNTFGSKRFSLVIRQNPAYAYHLLDFAAAKVTSSTDKQVQVTWKAENEQNYTHFTVERSIDSAKNFEVIGGVQAGARDNYSLLDKAPIAGQNLYRLKQEDINNNISYSKIVPVAYADLSNNLAKNAINVYPNPAKNTINLAITADINKPVTYNIMITNSSGLIIKQATSAQPEWQASINDLLPGTYLVKVINNTDNTLVGNTKFVKM